MADGYLCTYTQSLYIFDRIYGSMLMMAAASFLLSLRNQTKSSRVPSTRPHIHKIIRILLTKLLSNKITNKFTSSGFVWNGSPSLHDIIVMILPMLIHNIQMIMIIIK